MIQIRNKEKVIYSTNFTLKGYGAQSQQISVDLNEVYSQVPNGGVMIFKCYDPRGTVNSVNLERLIYL